jgi:hypothetical protein
LNAWLWRATPKLDDAQSRLWYAQNALQNGWSRTILVLQIESRAHLRQGKAQSNFPATLPPPDSDMAAQVFKDPYLFDFLGTDAPPAGGGARGRASSSTSRNFWNSGKAPSSPEMLGSRVVRRAVTDAA